MTIKLVRGPATWVLYLLLGLFAYVETAIGPSMPFLREKLDLDYTVASLHFSTIAIGSIVSGMFGERIARRVGRNTAVWGGTLGMALGGGLIAIGPNVVVTLLGAAMIGALGVIALITNQAALADLHGAGRAVALAESNVVASGAQILAPLAVGFFSQSVLGWSAGLLVILPVFAVSALFLARIPMPPAPETSRSGVGGNRLPSVFWAFWALLFTAGAVEWCVAYWGADFLETEVGFSQSFAAAAMSIFFTAMIGGRIVGARLTRRRLPGKLLVGSLIIAGVGLPILWLAESQAFALIGLFIAGAGIANFYPLVIGAATNAVPNQIDAATARLAIASGLSLLIMPLSLGWIADAIGMDRAFGFTLILVGAALGIALYANRLVARQPEHSAAADSSYA